MGAALARWLLRPRWTHIHGTYLIALACPACGTWRTDPTAYCTGCGL